MENVNSAVEMVLPLGVFITTIPRWVAASTSTLSTPTPERPTTRNLGAASMTFRVTFVSERTTIASTSVTTGSSSASGSRLSSTCTWNSGRCCKSAIPFGETGSQTKTFIKQVRDNGNGTLKVQWKNRFTHELIFKRNCANGGQTGVKEDSLTFCGKLAGRD